MYSVLITEDELLVRMGIASSVPWAQLGMRVVSETADGLSAWQAFEKLKPDIVIADIRMPRMDGMELLRRIHARDEGCAVILITNVEHDEMLAEARSLGVVAVLLKASMKRGDIMNAILRAKDRLVRDRREGTAEPEEDQTGWQRLLLGNGAEADFPGAYDPECFLAMQICPSERLSQRLEESLQNLFIHRLNTIGAFTTIPFEMGVFAIKQNGCDSAQLVRSLLELRRYVRDNFEVHLRFILHNYPIARKQLRLRADCMRRCFNRNDLFTDGLLYLDENALPIPKEYPEALQMLTRCAVLQPVSFEIQRWLEQMEVLPALLSESREQGQACAEAILVSMGEQAGQENIYHQLFDVTEKMCGAILSRMQTQIVEAAEYMNAHLSEKLTIQMVAQQVGYHPNYFSNLFKQELGMGYSDFLTMLRLRKAKQLMRASRDISLQSIADACGFPDLSYFSVRFKKMEGVTPSQWRAGL